MNENTALSPRVQNSGFLCILTLRDFASLIPIDRSLASLDLHLESCIGSCLIFYQNWYKYSDVLTVNQLKSNQGAAKLFVSVQVACDGMGLIARIGGIDGFARLTKEIESFCQER